MRSGSWGSKWSARGPWRSTCRPVVRSSSSTFATSGASGAAIGSTASRTTDCCTTCWRRSTYPMTEARELETRITRLFVERLEVEVPSPDLDLFQAGVVDSLLFVKLLAILEEEFGFRLAFEELRPEVARQIDRACLRKGGRHVAARFGPEARVPRHLCGEQQSPGAPDRQDEPPARIRRGGGGGVRCHRWSIRRTRGARPRGWGTLRRNAARERRNATPARRTGQEDGAVRSLSRVLISSSSSAASNGFVMK